MEQRLRRFFLCGFRLCALADLLRRYSTAPSTAAINSVAGKASHTPIMPPMAASRKAIGMMSSRPRSSEVMWAGMVFSTEVK